MVTNQPTADRGTVINHGIENGCSGDMTKSMTESAIAETSAKYDDMRVIGVMPGAKP